MRIRCYETEYYDYLVNIAMQPKKGGSDRRHDGDPLDHCLQQPIEAGDRQDPRRQERSRGQQTGGVQSGAGAWPSRRAGRPIVFGTTEEFLRNFGVDSTDNLPEISPVKMEDFRAEVEEEMQIKLDV